MTIIHFVHKNTEPVLFKGYNDLKFKGAPMRTKIFLFPFLFVLSSFFAFAFTPVQSDVNEFNQPTYTISDIFAATSTVDNPNSLYLSLTATRVSGSMLDYSIMVRYENSEKTMLNIPKGETLIFLIDGKKITLDGNGSINHRKYLVWHIKNTEELDDISYLSEKEKENVRATESAKYAVPHEVLEQLANAEEVKLKIRGESKSLIYTVPKDTLIDIKHFIKQYPSN